MTLGCYIFWKYLLSDGALELVGACVCSRFCLFREMKYMSTEHQGLAWDEKLREEAYKKGGVPVLVKGSFHFRTPGRTDTSGCCGSGG